MTRVNGGSPLATKPDPEPDVPFDLGAAVEKAKAEATGPLEVAFAWGDEEFTVPRVEDWPSDAIEDIEAGRLTEALEAVLGVEDYDRLVAVAGGTLTLRVMRLLLDHISEASGAGELGNSSASGRSRGRTTKR